MVFRAIRTAFLDGRVTPVRITHIVVTDEAALFGLVVAAVIGANLPHTATLFGFLCLGSLYAGCVGPLTAQGVGIIRHW